MNDRGGTLRPPALKAAAYLIYICERKGAGRTLTFGSMLKRWRAGPVPNLRYRRCNRLRCWRQTAQK